MKEGDDVDLLSCPSSEDDAHVHGEAHLSQHPQEAEEAGTSHDGRTEKAPAEEVVANFEDDVHVDESCNHEPNEGAEEDT
jgi:hypothetical protein